jgi:hypothetical protein
MSRLRSPIRSFVATGRFSGLFTVSILGWLTACQAPPPSPPAVANETSPAAVAGDPGASPPSPIADRPETPRAGWIVQPQADGTLEIQHQNTSVITSRYALFGANWRWAKPALETELAGREGAFRATAVDLGLTLDGVVTVRAPNQLSIEYTFTFAKPLKNISGAGMEFRVALDSSVWGDTPPQTAVQSAPPGWTLDRPKERLVAVAFSGHEPRVYLEKGKPDRIRAMFAEGDVRPTTLRSTMTITLPSDSAVAAPVAARYADSDPSTWPSQTLDWNDWPVDLSHLNADHRPAGKHGFVRARGDGLVFEDGTPARFWGTNIAANTLFRTDRDAIERHAKRLAAFGFNLVRIHHHDSSWVRLNVLDDGPTTQDLRDDALDALDAWIKALSDEGIYVWIDLHVARRFKPGDKIPGFDELVRTQKGEGKGFNYVNPRIEELMAGFEARYLKRRNRYTGKVWASDPAIVAVLVTNENDITDHFGNLMLPNKGNPHHQAVFETSAKQVANALGLPVRPSLKTWEPGPSKIVLAQLQARFGERAIDRLRDLGVRAPIATTSYWGNNKLYSIAPLVVGDVIDAHSYGKSEALSANPLHQANYIDFIAPAQVANKPLTVSEWNVPPPADDRFTAPLYIASVAALQGWDALMHYAYCLAPLRPPKRNNKWSAFNDPALMATMPAAALLFRRGDVATAHQTVALTPSLDAFYGTKTNASNSASIRTLAERSKLVLVVPDHPELKWDSVRSPSEVERVQALDRDFVGAKTTEIVSDTNELRRSWIEGIQTVVTPRTQSASGWLGGRKLELGATFVELETPKATVAFSSLDDRPLQTSKAILVTTIARAIAVGDRPGYAAEPVTGRIGIRSSAGPLVLVPLRSQSRLRPGTIPGGRPISAADAGGFQVFELPARSGTHWYVLRPKG